MTIVPGCIIRYTRANGVVRECVVERVDKTTVWGHWHDNGSDFVDEMLKRIDIIKVEEIINPFMNKAVSLFFDE